MTGLCGPNRSDLASRTELCGAFRVPSLRNAARTAPYFHNGAIKTLTDAVRFYVRRDTHPEEQVSTDTSGVVQKFNDLPAPAQKRTSPRCPTTSLVMPRPRRSEIADVVAFPNTLTDGYTP